MSRHQAFRNYDYENDLDEYEGGEYLDEEEDGDELSPEDRAQMAAATSEVKSALGPQASKVSTAQIQEALWHYYYDVDKSVAYLVNKFIDPAPPKQASAKAAKKGSESAAEADPWSVPSGLGAPPKMSKLQALAAARKKKGEEKKSEDKAKEPNQESATESLKDTTNRPTENRKSARLQFFSPPYMALNMAISDAFAKPSPDDAVLAAQSQAGKKTAPAAPKKKAGSEGVTNDMKALKVDTPLPKSKNLNVLNEFEKTKSKKSASFVVVGHVDAGKSTLMGRLLLDLNVVDQRTVDKYRKEAESIGKSSFALAWILDQRTEERSRGVTIDIATNKFETETTSFTILDAPGHRDFIPNMIAGASQADFAILVVDASKGAFEAGLKGQTKEHSLLIRSMGVSRIIVAVNKLDTVMWDKQRFDEICQQVSGFLSATGFQMKNISFVPVSGLNGDNLVKRSTDSAAAWYEGPTLIEELEHSEPMARALNKPLRMTISEVYRTPMSALTISGRIDAGSLQTGDAILVQPSGEKAYIKSLELDNQPAEWAVAGQNVVIHLTNIDPIHVRVGDIICDPAKPIQCVDTFTVKVLAFDILMPMQVDVHRGRLHSAGQIHELSALLDKVTGAVAKKKPKIVKPASVARIVVKMDSKVPLEAGQRVVLRSGGETVAAGLLE
ncbi:Elongation factor Tu GTP binding domain-containing protein [Pleurostoma richardsiae]|uniref:Elongation factor 1 alpha-like protein n=1 Tax=Pleurostoma richardsiae TaxID=41990 RepID=A0AA38RZD9_9PEZI|nr:Elongation factor Tu GTP binding domain-containing protein [Pleurostoma richardsiae]